MGSGDTGIRFREKIQGPRGQKNALFWAHAGKFLGQRQDWCDFESSLRQKNPHPGASSVSGAVSLITCPAGIQLDFSLSDLGFYYQPLVLLDRETKQIPAMALPCPVPSGPGADPAEPDGTWAGLRL